MKTTVSVIGPDPCSADESRAAEDLGGRIAGRGLVLVTGGLGGVMEAASRGAKRAGGLTVGILPGREPSQANHYVDIAIPTGMGELRNGLVVAVGEVVVAVGGGYGTLSEIGLALKGDKPVIGMQTWDLERNVEGHASIIAVASIDEAWREVEKALGSRDRG